MLSRTTEGLGVPDQTVLLNTRLTGAQVGSRHIRAHQRSTRPWIVPNRAAVAIRVNKVFNMPHRCGCRTGADFFNKMRAQSTVSSTFLMERMKMGKSGGGGGRFCGKRRHEGFCNPLPPFRWPAFSPKLGCAYKGTSPPFFLLRASLLHLQGDSGQAKVVQLFAHASFPANTSRYLIC